MLELYGKKFNSRLLLGTAQYPSPLCLSEAIKEAKAEIITVSIRRELDTGSKNSEFWQILQQMNLTILPNTANCYSVKEVVVTAQCAREIFQTDWIKLELIANADTLQPNIFGLIEAAKILISEGFKVFPYTTDDLIVAQKLYDLGCEVIMPWAAPIGSAQGILNSYNLKSMRKYLPNAKLIVDAGIGKPSHAAQAMELGFDAILLNTAIAKSKNPIKMAKAFASAVAGGHLGFEAGLLEARNMAHPSTPILGTAEF